MFKEFASKSIGRRVNFLFRLSMMHLRNEAKKIGLGSGDYTILFFLYTQDGLSQNDLSKRMRLDKSYIARAVASLEKMGMVTRKPDPDEHRIKRVYLDTKARKMEAAFFNLAKRWHYNLIKDIPSDELLVIEKGLDKMIKNAETDLEQEDLTKKFNRNPI